MGDGGGGCELLRREDGGTTRAGGVLKALGGAIGVVGADDVMGGGNGGGEVDESAAEAPSDWGAVDRTTGGVEEGRSEDMEEREAGGDLEAGGELGG